MAQGVIVRLVVVVALLAPITSALADETEVHIGPIDAVLAAAKPDAKTLWLPDMNHVLVDVSDNADNLMSYRQVDRPLDPALTDAVTGHHRGRALSFTAPRLSATSAPRLTIPRPGE